jgi:uncharacterized DUF497 family protein
MYYTGMEITWDPKKAKRNFQKHKIRFSDAEFALYDPMALVIEDHDIEGEQRFVNLGSDSIGCIVVIVYAYQGNEIRMISARKATPSERKQYEERI